MTRVLGLPLVGGLSAKDAAAFVREMSCEPEFLQGMRKHRDHTEFACFVRNVTPRPIRLTVPFGEMERQAKLSATDHAALLAQNRSRFAGGNAAPGEPRTPEKPAVQQTTAAEPGHDLDTPDVL